MLSRVDQAELLLALHDRQPGRPFAMFLERLRRRVGAGAALVLHRGRGGLERWHSGPDDPASIDLARLETLRAGRAYDLRAMDDGLPPARAVRDAAAGLDCWLVIVHGAFSAADSALLLSLAPHVLQACDIHQRIAVLERDARLARDALARAGVGWALVDRQGARVAGAQPDIERREMAALQARLADGAEAAATTGTLAITPASVAERDHALLLSRHRPVGRARAAAFAAIHGVAMPEARLAVALAEGASIREAADRLNLTEQTARFYTKRLYAATGARGQADLVRLFWTGVAALA